MTHIHDIQPFPAHCSGAVAWIGTSHSNLNWSTALWYFFFNSPPNYSSNQPNALTIAHTNTFNELNYNRISDLPYGVVSTWCTSCFLYSCVGFFNGGSRVPFIASVWFKILPADHSICCVRNLCWTRLSANRDGSVFFELCGCCCRFKIQWTNSWDLEYVELSEKVLRRSVGFSIAIEEHARMESLEMNTYGWSFDGDWKKCYMNCSADWR